MYYVRALRSLTSVQNNCRYYAHLCIHYTSLCSVHFCLRYYDITLYYICQLYSNKRATRFYTLSLLLYLLLFNSKLLTFAIFKCNCRRINGCCCFSEHNSNGLFQTIFSPRYAYLTTGLRSIP